MAWNTPKTWSVGDVLTASEMNTYVRDNTGFLNAPPSCRAYNSAAISINNNTITALTFNSERWDTDSIHSTVTNTERLTATTAGIYHIYGSVAFAANSTGDRALYIYLSGSVIYSSMRVGAATGRTICTISTEISMAVSDYVTLHVFQDRGGSLNVDTLSNYSPEFGMTYLGKAST